MTIRCLLKGRPTWKIHINYREGKTVANQLAEVALAYEEEKIWIEEGIVSTLSTIMKEKLCTD